MRKRENKSRRWSKGQSLVEMALLFPVLLIMLSGMVEVGFLMTRYLAVLDSARNAARFSADSVFSNREVGNTACTGADPTEDFYMQTACAAMLELEQEEPTVTLDPAIGDDIVVTALTVVGGAAPHISARHPVANGWSYAQTITGTRNEISRFTSAEVADMLQTGAPNTGLVIVEITYHYDQILELPWITAFLPNPLPLHVYSFMPLVSAEPTSTPAP